MAYSRRSLHSDADESCKWSSTCCFMPAASHLYIYFLAVYYNLYAIPSYCKTLPNFTATVHRGTYFYVTLYCHQKVSVKPATAFSGRPVTTASRLLAAQQEDTFSNSAKKSCCALSSATQPIVVASSSQLLCLRSCPAATPLPVLTA